MINKFSVDERSICGCKHYRKKSTTNNFHPSHAILTPGQRVLLPCSILYRFLKIISENGLLPNDEGKTLSTINNQ